MSEEGGRTEPLEELPFPGRRARPIHEVREPFGGSRDPLSGTQFSSLQETPPQHEVVARAEASRRRGGDRIPKFPTLETMYAAFPDVARIGKLRVVRIEPQWWNDGYTGQRVRVNGILGYHEKPISTQEISKMYGGYKYQVFGMLEQTDREDFGGPPKLVDVAFAEFTLPVDPVPEARPVEGEDEMHSPWPFFGGRRGVPQGVPQQSGGDMTPLLAWAERMARGNGSQSAPSSRRWHDKAR